MGIFASASRTPANVAELAKSKSKIDVYSLTLLGIMGDKNAPRAMFRLPNGTIITGKLGDKTRAGEIIAIGETKVHLRKGRSITILELPS